MDLIDTITLDGARRTSGGYLVADARVARTGIQLYRGAEMGRPEMEIVRVYRPESEVFSADAMHSFAHRPVTVDHPREAVTAENWRKHARGQTGGEIARDGQFVRVPLVLMDAEAIKAVEAGKRELSMGYSAKIEWTPGVTDSGERYDAIQREIRANHLAVVTTARGGPALKIGDVNRNPQGGHSMADNLRKVVVDGLTIETTDQGAEAIAKLQRQISDASVASAKADADHASAIAAKDAEIAKRDAQIDELKGKVMDEATLDAAVQKRADLLAVVAAIAPDVKTAGLSDADIRKAVVLAKIGDAIKDKPAAYIDARFDILAEDAAKSAKASGDLRTAIGSRGQPAMADAASAANGAWAKGVEDLNAWRNQAQK